MKRFYAAWPLAMILGLMLVPEIASAQAWETTLQTLVDWLTDTTGRLLAVIAIAGMGIMALAGRLDIRWGLAIIIGIALIWGAAELVDAFWA